MRNAVSRIRQSLSQKLGLSILLMTVPVFLASLGVLFEESRRHIMQEATEHLTAVLNTQEHHVVRYLSTVETATNATAWLVTNNLNPDSLLEYSRRVVMLNVNVSGCSITTEPDMFPQYGRYFSAYTVRQGDTIVTEREKEYEYFDKVWYATPKKQERACWVDPFDDTTEGTLAAEDMIASYCRPLVGANGHFIGVIASDLSLPMLSKSLSSEPPYTNSYLMLLGEEGHYFVHPDSTRLVNQTIFQRAEGQNSPDIIALGHEMTTGHKGSMRVTIDGVPSLVCYRPVSGTEWSLAIVCPDSDVLSGYHRLINLVAVLIVAGLLLILWFCRRIISRSILPLQRLVEQSQRIAAGQYDEHIARTGRQDAVGQLQNSFAAMQESLEHHISEIQTVNDETARRNEELLKASQMVEAATERKALFIQNMSHQIRTPLNIIMGFAQVLHDSEGALPPEEVQSIVSMIRHNALTLLREVTMLYDSSDTGLSEEMASHRQDQVSCNDVASEAIAHTRLHFPDIPVNFETALPDSFTISTNRLYLMRSLREILYNSAKYSDGQHVSLRVSATDKSTVRFVFEDTGPGIAEDYYDQMFVPFSKVDDLSEGLGLGLPLTMRHIRNLGGTLVFDTTYHDGCRFVVELPT